MTSVRTATLLFALTLAGCAGEPLGLTTAQPTTPQASAGMSGRWILSAPNAPPCGMSFGAAPGATEGAISPEGGCPGRFFLSRRWAMSGVTLTISDQDSNALGELKQNGAGFEGQAATGMKVTLTR